MSLGAPRRYAEERKLVYKGIDFQETCREYPRRVPLFFRLGIKGVKKKIKNALAFFGVIYIILAWIHRFLNDWKRSV